VRCALFCMAGSGQSFFWRSSGVLLVLLRHGLRAYAQGAEADVSGHVTDNSGAIIAAAHIALTNRDTGVSREIDSTDGAYHFQPVLPGHYDLTVTASGFARRP
jgi:hypothetical protein